MPKRRPEDGSRDERQRKSRRETSHEVEPNKDGEDEDMDRDQDQDTERGQDPDADEGERELEGILESIDNACVDEDLESAWRELRKARKRFPGELAFREWEAVLLAESGDLEAARTMLEEVLAADGDRPFAIRELGSILMELGRFRDSVGMHERLLGMLDASDDPEEVAGARFDIAVAQERLGDTAAADKSFREAALLDPGDYPVPTRLPREEFEETVKDALDRVPSEFDEYLGQVVVRVTDVPPPGAPGPFILGLYEGIPRTERTQEVRDHLDTVWIFQRNHELLNLDEEELREEIQKTVIHEIAHHFGLGEEDMGDYA